MRRVVSTVVLILAASLAPLPQAHAAARPYTVTATVSSNEPVIGQTVSITGSVSPNAAGEFVYLQKRYSQSGAWITEQRSKVWPIGKYKLTDRPSSLRTRWYRVYKPASRGHAADHSGVMKVTVYQWFYLAQLDMVDEERFDDGTSDIGGRHFAYSVMNDVDFWWDHTPWGEWNLGYKCKTLSAAVGIDDSSATGYEVGFVAYRDGAETDFGVKGLGPASVITLGLRSRLRLRLEDQYVAGPTGSGSGHGFGVWGNARVLCSGRP